MEFLNKDKHEIMLCMAKRKLQGVMNHNDVSDIFNLMNLGGYHLKHRKQAKVEMVEFNKIKDYIIKNYNHIPDVEGPFERVNPKNIVEKGDRMTLTKDNKKVITHDIFDILIKHETTNVEYLNSACKELTSLGCYGEYELLRGILEDTSKELESYKKSFIKYNDLDWDMCYIIESDKLYESFLAHDAIP